MGHTTRKSHRWRRGISNPSCHGIAHGEVPLHRPSSIHPQRPIPLQRYVSAPLQRRSSARGSTPALLASSPGHDLPAKARVLSPFVYARQSHVPYGHCALNHNFIVSITSLALPLFPPASACLSRSPCGMRPLRAVLALPHPTLWAAGGNWALGR